MASLASIQLLSQAKPVDLESQGRSQRQADVVAFGGDALRRQVSLPQSAVEFVPPDANGVVRVGVEDMKTEAVVAAVPHAQAAERPVVRQPGRASRPRCPGEPPLLDAARGKALGPSQVGPIDGEAATAARAGERRG
jgi:hypothetical protein